MTDAKMHWSETVQVNSIIVRVNKANPDAIEQIVFDTHLGDITHRPKKTIVTSKEKEGLKFQEKSSEPMTLADLRENVPDLFEFNKLIDDKPKDAILCFTEKDFEFDGEIKTYRFMSKRQLENAYFPDYHKEDKSKVEAQEKHKLIVEKRLE